MSQQCKVIRGNGQRCRNAAIDRDWCQVHHPDAKAVAGQALDEQADNPEPSTPAGDLAAFDDYLARLRAARDEAEQAAAAALARANQISIEVIAATRARQALVMQATANAGAGHMSVRWHG